MKEYSKSPRADVNSLQDNGNAFARFRDFNFCLYFVVTLYPKALSPDSDIDANGAISANILAYLIYFTNFTAKSSCAKSSCAKSSCNSPCNRSI